MSEPVLRVEDLRVALPSGAAIVDGVSIELNPGELLGVVGESGSGKTTVALALLGYTKPGVDIVGGSVMLDGRDLTRMSERELRSMRGRVVSYVPQDPGTALNPSMRVSDQLAEIRRVHRLGRDAATIDALLERVKLPTTKDFKRRYPHQLSGGQQQRLAIAAAIACDPKVVVLDEPTTGLDVVTQAHILVEVARLCRERSVALLYVSHDLAAVASIATRIAVMYAGLIVEAGPREQVLSAPSHPYTAGLIGTVPDHVVPRRLTGIPGMGVDASQRPAGCPFEPRCALRVEACSDGVPELLVVGSEHRARCIRWTHTMPPVFEPRTDLVATGASDRLFEVADLHAGHRARGGDTVAAAGVSFGIDRGECVALVGESGSGKTTIARCVVGLHAPSSGTIALDGRPLAPLASGRGRTDRRDIQIVFQNPYDSLNPRRTVADAVSWSARSLRGLSPSQARAEVGPLLERVRLSARLADRYPGELSGGERQRVAIARALAAGPKVLVCDEVTSALDVSVQAAVLELLAELRHQLGLAVLFITHDLGVVASIADRLLVLEHGVVCEEGPVAQVLTAPAQPYTQNLVASAPSLITAAPGGDH
ncbi:MAG: peptide/nickel transport system ATP-binding protein ddpF [Gaiellales bacterium]|nr:peptide/nickel transport system ATP-binding protein ddpF [Gaiellales bacterium]